MTDRASPVINAESEPRRKTTARATSSDVSSRPSGGPLTQDSSTSSGVMPRRCPPYNLPILHACGYFARTHAVGTNPMGSEFMGHGVGEAGDAELRSHILRKERDVALLGRHGGYH